MGYSDSDSDDRRLKKKKKRRSRSRSISSDTSRASSRKSKKKSKKKERRRSRSPDRYRRSRSRDRKRSRSPDRYRRSHSRSKDRSRRSSRERPVRSRSRSRERFRRSRSGSRSRDRFRRSRSDSRSRDRFRRSSSDSRSRVSYRRSRSPNRERRKRSRSGSRSRRGRSHSKSPGINVSDPAASIPGYEHMTASEKAEARMKLALKAAAAADEKIRARHEEGSGKSWSPSLTFEEQRKRQKAIDEIESSGFNPVMFTSNRAQTLPEAGLSTELTHDSAIFGSGVIIPPKVTLTTTNNTEGIMHPNLYVSEKDKMDLWVKKLTQMRRRKLEGDVLT